MGPQDGPSDVLWGILATCRGYIQAYSRYMRIPRLRAHTRGLPILGAHSLNLKVIDAVVKALGEHTSIEKWTLKLLDIIVSQIRGPPNRPNIL